MNNFQDSQVASMFSNISRWYDVLNHVLSLGVDIYWRKKLLQSVPKNLVHTSPIFLDLATGTMDVAIALEKKFSNLNPIIIGIDLSFNMLRFGLKKIRNIKSIYPIQGNGKKLPVKTSSVDVITIAFGIRNINPRDELYKEVIRILKPGGVFLILEFSPPRKKIMFGLYNFYLSKILPFIGNFISGDQVAYTYLKDTIMKFPSPFDLKQELLYAGFSKVRYCVLTSGIVSLHKAVK